MATVNIFNMADTWNNVATTYTAIKMNVTDTASASGSLLLDLQVGGASAFNVTKDGSVKLGINSSGTNVAGTNVVIAGSQGTGTGAGGSIIFQVAPAGSSGTAQNALATAWQISGAGHLLAGTDNTRDIGAIGANRPRSIYTGAGIFCGGDLQVANGLNFSAKGYLYAQSDGVFTLYDNAATSFGRLQFGGTTSSFPALKRSSAILQARLADDSDFAPLQGQLRTHNAYTAGAPTATGYIVLYDSTGTAYKVPAEAL